jgi:hypothetical protein
MQFADVIRRSIRKSGQFVDLVADVNAAVAANVGEDGATTHVSSSQMDRRSATGKTSNASKDHQQQGR